jgi:hypothetical protein
LREYKARIQYALHLLEYEAVYLGRYTYNFLLGVQTVYLGQNTKFCTYAGVKDGLPWSDEKLIYLGHKKLFLTFAGVQRRIPWLVYKMDYLG